MLLGTGGTIPAKSVTHMEVSCSIKEQKIIYPFAYRTHTHSLGLYSRLCCIPSLTIAILGKVVSGYKVHRDNGNSDHWTLLGRRNPLTPQMFYPVFSKDAISYGDKLVCIIQFINV